MTPIQLFYFRFYYHQASFFHLEVLQQSKVSTYVVLVEKSGFPDVPSYYHYDPERWDTESVKRYLTPRHKGPISDQGSDAFNQFKQLTSVSLAECKDYVLKTIDVGGPQINHSYFGVPQYLIALRNFEAVENLDSARVEMLDLEKVRALYTEEKFNELE